MEISNKVSKVNTEPLISIVVPAYNIEAYLPRCLDSIMSQTYQNIEIVLVDKQIVKYNPINRNMGCIEICLF